MTRWLVLFALLLGCTGERPPPRVCEPPAPEPKKTGGIGSCPIDWGHDAGADAPTDGQADAPTDAHDARD